VANVNRRPVLTLVVLAGLLLVPASAAPAAPAAPGATTRISVASGGAQANRDSGGSAVSANGRYVAFESAASNLVPGDSNGLWDVFVRDRVAGATTRVSVASGGAQANDGSGGPTISADGRYVAFLSGASNLVAGDTNGVGDVFVRDRVAGATTRVSVASSGTQASSGSDEPVISADGRYVAFVSMADNLVPGDTNRRRDVFVRDRVTGATTRVSVTSGGSQAISGPGTASGNGSEKPAISADGRYVTFLSMAGNLVPGDTNRTPDVFVHDRVTGATTRVSVASGGTQANNDSDQSAISADGRYVAFTSLASNLVPADTNGLNANGQDVFVRDRVAGATTRVSLGSGGAQANGYSQGPAISGDGRYVTFESLARNLVPGDSNGLWDVFVRDRVAGATTRASVTSAGTQANHESAGPGISANGRYVAFQSEATNLVAGDTNGMSDVFLRDRLAPATPFGDFTGDGWSDLIARQTSSGSLYLYRGNGTALATGVRIGTGWNSMNVITRFGDFNRDGHEDVITRERATGALWLYRGTGAGFSSRLKIGSGWSGMREITPVGDFTGDGYPDLLAVQATTGYLHLYPGRGTSLRAVRWIGAGWNAMSELVCVGDVNRDGHVDLIARHDPTGALWLYRGTGTGLGSGVRVGTGWSGMRDLVGIGDFDRDGLTDLTAVQSATGKLLRYPWRGTSFGTPVVLGSGWTAAMGPLL